MSQTVSIPELLSVGLTLLDKAGEIIREVAESGRLDTHDKGELASASTEKYEDPQTIADRRSQTLIISTLRKMWPDLVIVGEEEGLQYSPEAELPTLPPKTRADVTSKPFPEHLHAVPIKDVCVWVDPLDGTREFTKGIYSDVTVLFGITLGDSPVAGVIHEPFRKVTGGAGPASPGHSTWGCVGAGLFDCIPDAEGVEGEALALAVTCSRSTAALEETLGVLGATKVLRMGGSGNKILRVLEGRVHAYLNTGSGTFRWDSCAGQALLLAAGGTLTDMNGGVYPYVPGPHETLRNGCGLVAAMDPAVGRRVVAATSRTESTQDILRDVEGAPLDLDWFRQTLVSAGFADATTQLLSVDAPESLATRTRHSHVAAVLLRAQSPSPLPRALLLKRCVARDLEPRTEAKLHRDVRSYANEAAFLAHFAGVLSDGAGLRLARTLHSHSARDAEMPIDSKFLTVVEFLDGFEQHLNLDYDQLCGSLAQIARLHAHCWENKAVLDLARTHLWHHGSYWDMGKRECAPGELEAMPQRAKELFERLQPTGGVFADASVLPKFQFLQRHAQRLASEVESRSNTLIHGDYKSGNIFFATGRDHAACAAAGPEEASQGMAMIDWQWTGIGCCAQDVVYVLATACAPGVHCREAELLQFYHGQLAHHLAKKGVSTYSYDQFTDDYETCALDYFRMFMGYIVKGINLDSIQANKLKVNRGVYARELEGIRWPVQKALELIDKVLLPLDDKP